jgi:2-phospho-L-lactate guanylyltransferase
MATTLCRGAHRLLTVTSPPLPVAVVVPIKSFRLAKERLATRLSPSEREALAMAMAARVVAAAAPLPVFVATEDPEVAEWASERGADALLTSSTGLNPSVTEAVQLTAAHGFGCVVIAHSDLPLARSFSHLLPESHGRSEVVVVPDRHRDGTNVLVTPTHPAPVFAYGPASMHRHVYTAARAGHSVRVVVDAELGWDIDHPEDLDLPGGPDALGLLVSPSVRGARV